MYDRPTTRGYYDEFMDQVARNGQLVIEQCELVRRERALEEFIRGIAEHNLNGGHCRMGECIPEWDPQAGRHVQTEPCSLATGEELLRGAVRLRTHYGINAPDEREPYAEHLRGGR
jgi:hypothetical protein